MALSAATNWDHDFGIPSERHLRVVGRMATNEAAAIRDAVTAIADNYVSDDIIVDLRDVPSVDDTAVAMLTGAGHHARELGHRVVVQAQDPVSRALDIAASSGALVVID